MHKKTTVHNLLIIILLLATIFLSSNMNSKNSNNTSKTIIYKTIEISASIIGKNLPKQRIEIITNQVNFPFRKCMHASVYFLLAILTINVFQEIKIDKWKKYMYTILFCFVCAIIDELHQLGVEGRNGQFLDVLIDTAGCIIGIGIYILFQTFQNKRKNKLKS